jgi:hypothetical protein
VYFTACSRSIRELPRDGILDQSRIRSSGPSRRSRDDASAKEHFGDQQVPNQSPLLQVIHISSNSDVLLRAQRELK